eukprot:SAG31_NODE_11840_length_993_cov_1.391499_1_plen_80_part_00
MRVHHVPHVYVRFHLILVEREDHASSGFHGAHGMLIVEPPTAWKKAAPAASYAELFGAVTPNDASQPSGPLLSVNCIVR